MQTLRLYCDVASFRSFSQAAAKNGVTQSAASQRMGQLEKRLGVMLIDRSVRPLGLTEAGQEFLRGCLALVTRYDRLEERVARLRPKPSGEVLVDAIYSAGIDLLNQVKETFEQAHPRVRVGVEYKRPEAVYEAVLQRRCDLGILSYPKRWREVGALPLRNERMAVVVAPEHPLARRATVRAKDLGTWPMVAFETDLPASRSIKRYLREQGVETKVTAMFDNVDTIKSALGVTQDHFAILPKRTVLREAAAGALAVVDLEPALVRPLGVIFHRPAHAGDRPFSPAAQLFVDYLLEHAGSDVDQTQEEEAKRGELVGAK